MRHPFASLAAVAVLLAAPLATVAQEPRATLLVAVVDDSTGTALERARVRLEARPGAWFTDRAGRAELKNVEAGTQTVEVSMPGYAMRRFPLQLAGGANEPVQVRLTPQADEVLLDELRVTSWGRSRLLRTHGFYDRKQMGGYANFLTREEIENRKPRALLDVFRRLPGWRVVPARGRVGRRLLSNRAQGLTLNGSECPPDIYLDGISLGKGGETGLDDLDNISWETVEGIEAYPSSASIPVQYNATGSACGVVLIWTR